MIIVKDRKLIGVEEDPIELGNIIQISNEDKKYVSYVRKGDLIIPEDGSVVEIAEKAFEDNRWLRTLTGNEHLENIGKWAFYDCESLVEVSLDGKMEKIEEGTFNNCTALERIAIKDKIKIIEQLAFAGCDALESISIGDGLIVIDNNAFYHCERLKNIVIPDSVQYIGDSAFDRCDALKEINIPFHLKEISSEAFFYSGLQKVTINSVLPKYKRKTGCLILNKLKEVEIVDKNTQNRVVLKANKGEYLQIMYNNKSICAVYDNQENIKSICYIEDGRVFKEDINKTIKR